MFTLASNFKGYESVVANKEINIDKINNSLFTYYK